MSTSQSQSHSLIETRTASTDAEALGARGNWWGREDLEVEHPEHGELQGITRERWIAGKLLRGPSATLYCPKCYHEDEVSIELSDPEHYVPESELELEADDGEIISIPLYGDYRRHRHCTGDCCGYVSWGGLLADRPMSEFLELVRTVLVELDVPERYRNELVARAQSRKARGQRDERNMEAVLRELRYGADAA